MSDDIVIRIEDDAENSENPIDTEMPAISSSSGNSLATEGMSLASYLAEMVRLLTSIDANVFYIRDERGQTEDVSTGPGISGNGKDLGQQLSSLALTAIQAVNVANLINNPIDASLNLINTFTKQAGNAVGLISTSIAAAITSFVPGGSVIGPAVKFLMDTTAGAIVMFVDTLTKSIQTIFDYADRMIDTIAPFSPDAVGAFVDRELKMLNFQLGAANSSGNTFASLYSAQTDLLLAVEDFKLRLFTLIEPSAEFLVNVTTNIINTLTKMLQKIDEIPSAVDFINLLQFAIGNAAGALGAPLIQILESIEDWLKKMSADMDKDNRAGEIAALQQAANLFGWNPPPKMAP